MKEIQVQSETQYLKIILLTFLLAKFHMKVHETVNIGKTLNRMA